MAAFKNNRTALVRSLLAWYDENHRALPFRDNPSPYAVWVSEIMLQQTRAEVVAPYFERWIEALPDLESLAQADEETVLKLWQGLGYYSRARRLQAGARFVIEHFEGALPQLPQELLRIPGIGPYSAGAISSIAFGERSALVDGNVIRVLTRLFGLQGDPTRAPLKAKLWQLADDLVPAQRPGDFNQALMELGAVVCSRSKPSCIACPWRKACVAFKEGLVESLPQLPKRSPPTPLTMVVALVQHRGRYAVQRLPKSAPWWAGLDAFPFAKLANQDASFDEVKIAALQLAGASIVTGTEVQPDLKHSVTKYRIKLVPCLVRVSERGVSAEGIRWIYPKELWKLALPAPHRRLLKILMG